VAVTKPASQSDAGLVLSAQAGDKDAFGELIDRHQPMVVALVRRLIGSGAMATDAAQEAAVTALVGLSRLRSPDRFGAWYAGIALNIARRWLRAARPAAQIIDDLRDEALGPDELAEAGELAKRVRDAVQALPRGQRQAVLAFYWQGLSHMEAAAELTVSPGAVKARLHQARAALAPELAPYTQPAQEVRPVPGTEQAAWVDVEVSEVRRSDDDDPSNRAHAVVLKEIGGDRQLPIYIGAPEAIALACSLETVETPRPMTYQFAADLVNAGGLAVGEVRVTRLSEFTFYAVVVLAGPGGALEVDARPSDALNLAVVCGAPVRVHSALFEEVSVERYDAWQRYKTGAPELAGEARDRRAKQWEKITGASREHTGE
jgi:RNA polymerase sigma factor (sigma-70 family)